jgi:hypothetical protein
LLEPIPGRAQEIRTKFYWDRFLGEARADLALNKPIYPAIVKTT